MCINLNYKPSPSSLGQPAPHPLVPVCLDARVVGGGLVSGVGEEAVAVGGHVVLVVPLAPLANLDLGTVRVGWSETRNPHRIAETAGLVLSEG